MMDVDMLNICLCFTRDQVKRNYLLLVLIVHEKATTMWYWHLCICLVQVQLRTEVLRTPTRVQTLDLQIMTVHFMSLRCLLWPLSHQWLFSWTTLLKQNHYMTEIFVICCAWNINCICAKMVACLNVCMWVVFRCTCMYVFIVFNLCVSSRTALRALMM